MASIYLSEAFSNDSRDGDPRDGDAHDADVLVLGCTHYPLIKPLLRRIAPDHVTIVDSAESTAEAVAHQLENQPNRKSLPLPAPAESALESVPQLKFFATDSAEKFRKMGTRFLGLPVEDVMHVDLNK